MALERLTTLDRAAGANLESLGCALLGFHLRHVLPSFFVYAAGRPTRVGTFRACSTCFSPVASAAPSSGRNAGESGKSLTSSCAAPAPSPSVALRVEASP